MRSSFDNWYDPYALPLSEFLETLPKAPPPPVKRSLLSRLFAQR